MQLSGVCQCGSCEITAEGPVEVSELVPRVCDCEYCQAHPSAVISNPKMTITIRAKASNLYEATNGSGQATFYHCKSCNQLLAVGATFGGVTMGAVNAFLFGNPNQFAEPISIQPRLLSPVEKIERWSRIWGGLKVSYI